MIDRRTGQGVPRLRVEAWDKDMIVDDRLGTAPPEGAGAFTIVFDFAPGIRAQLRGAIPEFNVGHVTMVPLAGGTPLMLPHLIHAGQAWAARRDGVTGRVLVARASTAWSTAR